MWGGFSRNDGEITRFVNRLKNISWINSTLIEFENIYLTAKINTGIIQDGYVDGFITPTMVGIDPNVGPIIHTFIDSRIEENQIGTLYNVYYSENLYTKFVNRNYAEIEIKTDSLGNGTGYICNFYFINRIEEYKTRGTSTTLFEVRYHENDFYRRLQLNDAEMATDKQLGQDTSYTRNFHIGALGFKDTNWIISGRPTLKFN